MATAIRLTVRQLLGLQQLPLPSAVKYTCEQVIIRSNAQLSLLAQPLYLPSAMDNDGLPKCFDARSIDTLQRVHADIAASLTLFTANYKTESGLAMAPSSNNKIAIDDRFVAGSLDTLIARHGLTVETYTEAVFKTLLARGDEALNRPVIDAFLRNHISIGVLLQHGHGLLEQALSPNAGAGRVGAVSPDTDLAALAEDVALQVTTLAEHNYNCCPEIRVTSTLPADAAPVVTVPYMARYVLLELLKNAVHASVILAQRGSVPVPADHESEPGVLSARLEPVDVSISEERPGGDVLVTLRDRGGGIDDHDGDPALLEALQRSFLHSKRHLYSPQQAETGGAASITEQLMYGRHVTYQPQSAPLAGLGVGLFLTTLYAEHFGGALILRSDAGPGGGITAVYRIPRNLAVAELGLAGVALRRHEEEEERQLDSCREVLATRASGQR